MEFLSGGESQRIRLATQIGSALLNCGCFFLPVNFVFSGVDIILEL